MDVPAYYVASSPGAGKSHLAAAIGLALVEHGWRVLFMRTSDLVQRLQIARRELALNKGAVRADRKPLRVSLNADHHKPAIRGMEQGVPGFKLCRWQPSTALSITQ